MKEGVEYVEREDSIVLSAEEQDTIGEIMNISMGAAATAVSTMLEKQVAITTPRLEQEQLKDIDCAELEPAIIVKINYIHGIEGCNVIMLRRRDMRIILDLLMGNEYAGETEDFQFDEMSMSAACEVMNQMMGASATAMSEVLSTPVNISIPEAHLVETSEEIESIFSEIRGEDQVVSISFKMMIKGVLDTTFRCFITEALAREIVDAVNPVAEPEPEAPEAPVLHTSLAGVATLPEAEQAVRQAEEIFAQAAQQQMPQTQFPAQQMPQTQFPTQQMPTQQMPTQQMPPAYAPRPYQQPVQMPPAGYMPQEPAYYGAQRAPDARGQTPQIAVKAAEFPDFSRQAAPETPYSSNLGLLMGVQLEVSVVIGRTKRKIKDIMEFGQGSVIMLETQTGAPAEIVVNGQLIAYGDVVVVGDNFGVRITEIVGTKDLMASLGSHSLF